MNVLVVYVYPFNGKDGRHGNAVRFLESYQKFPAGADHRVMIISNGEPPSPRTEKLFQPIIHKDFFVHDNSGYDIGAFQHVARDVSCDLMVFFGNSAYLRGPNWMSRMVESYQAKGDNLYGSMHHTGHLAVGVWPHIRTTGFWMSRILLLRYPILVHSPEQRYPFEHGPDGLTSWCARNAGVYCVTWEGMYALEEWHKIVGGYHDGEQKHMITGDRMSCPPFHPFS